MKRLPYVNQGETCGDFRTRIGTDENQEKMSSGSVSGHVERMASGIEVQVLRYPKDYVRIRVRPQPQKPLASVAGGIG